MKNYSHMKFPPRVAWNTEKELRKSEKEVRAEPGLEEESLPQIEVWEDMIGKAAQCKAMIGGGNEVCSGNRKQSVDRYRNVWKGTQHQA